MFASSAPVLLLALSNSTLTAPVNVVSTAVLVRFSATTSRVNAVPASLVYMVPMIAPAAVLLSNTLNRPGLTFTTVNTWAFDVPPPSAGLNTSMLNAPDAVISLARMVTVSCVALT